MTPIPMPIGDVWFSQAPNGMAIRQRHMEPIDSAWIERRTLLKK